MRLEKIKLAGFKSFVDPTTVLLPSNLVGVVGPNGCGKSNVIDAVRWVMGESSAKMLRGESMADVIFNGSTGRKPVGLASIELVFDNADGSAGAELARFNQISVKRQVSRDGQSNYFLNGSRCRRRDIQDLFLGTGLGPRSYAIIEQGMISRIIEARAEELRLFLEEAAGISKYKERRKETESRMRATRENLERLEDLREEVGKQLLHLERQADTAARYTELKAEERRLELELKALRWRTLDDEIAGQDRRIAALETDQEAGVARQRRLEADIEGLRERYTAASEHFNQVQGRFYAVGSEIARAEQAIQFANESRGRSEAELVRLDQELSESSHHLRRDTTRLDTLADQLRRDEPLLAEAEAALSEAVSVVGAAEDQQRAWEGEWDRFNQEAAEPASQAQVERARINHLEQRIGRDQERIRRIDEELERLDAGPVAERIRALEAQGTGIEARMEAAEREREAAAADLVAQEAQSRGLAGRARWGAHGPATGQGPAGLAPGPARIRPCRHRRGSTVMALRARPRRGRPPGGSARGGSGLGDRGRGPARRRPQGGTRGFLFRDGSDRAPARSGPARFRGGVGSRLAPPRQSGRSGALSLAPAWSARRGPGGRGPRRGPGPAG